MEVADDDHACVFDRLVGGGGGIDSSTALSFCTAAFTLVVGRTDFFFTDVRSCSVAVAGVAVAGCVRELSTGLLASLVEDGGASNCGNVCFAVSVIDCCGFVSANDESFISVSPDNGFGTENSACSNISTLSTSTGFSWNDSSFETPAISGCGC
jgi:hypothetical protein